MRLAQGLITSLLFLPSGLARDLCTSSQKCWPSSDVWSSFNTSVGGRLVAPRPPAWPCHDPNYDEAACQIVTANWNSSFWRANQTGAMQDLVWESPGCDIYSPRNVSCEQGFVPAYAVVAQDPDDVSKAVSFAGKHKLRLVVKNTGHDYLGRSSAAGSLSIWTRKLKGIKFTESFVATGCSKSILGVPAVTLGAAEQWLDVYRAADEHNVTIVGGAANSVGAAGGWVQGGGHSPLGWLYGMGVDNVLQFTVVKPDGKVVTANACRNKDLFWALRGGGGSTWGVTLDVTYKTHPPLNSIVGLGITLNVTSPDKLVDLAETFLRALPSMSDLGLRGYGVWIPPATFSLIAIHPNSPDMASTNKTLQPIWEWISQNNGTQAGSFGYIHPSFYEFLTTWITDINIGINTWLGSRLVSRTAMEKNSKKLARLAPGDGGSVVTSVLIIGGGAVSKADPESTGLNPQWRNDALVSWNFGSSWPENASANTVEGIKNNITKLTQELGEVAGLDHASYFNEADPREPRWKKAFFGGHYDRLLKIKREVDPYGLFTCNRCVGSDM